MRDVTSTRTQSGGTAVLERPDFEERLAAIRRQLAEIVLTEAEIHAFPVPRMDPRYCDATPEQVAAAVADYRTPAPPNRWGMETMLGLRVSERLADLR